MRECVGSWSLWQRVIVQSTMQIDTGAVRGSLVYHLRVVIEDVFFVH